jgi:hypothetical protein
MSRARWPSSPTARSCDCLHRGSNAQAVSKTGGARLLFCWRRASTCRWRAQVVSRGGWRASRRARKLGGGAAADGVRVCTCSMCAGLARPRAAAGPTDSCARCMRCCRPGRGAHLRAKGWLEEVGDEVDRGLGRLARAPRRGDMCAWVLCVRSGVAGLGEEGGTRAEIAPRTEWRRPPARRTPPATRRRVVM